MRAQDIEALRSVGRPTIAPDGSFAVFAVSRPDLGADRNVGQLWRADLPHGPVRRITRGTADAAPQLSPNGTVLAFVRRDVEDRPQLFVAAATGGEAVQTTDAPLGILRFAWSPDGNRLAYLARVPEVGRYGTVEGLGADAEGPRRITGARWHANGVGYLADRPAHVFVVPVPDVDAEPSYPSAASAREPQPPEPRVVPTDAIALTSGPASHSLLAFSADGSSVISDVDELDRGDLRSMLVAVQIDAAGERVILPRTAGLSVHDIAVTADGTIAVLAQDVGADGTDFVAAPVSVWTIAGGTVHRLTRPDVVDGGEAHLSTDRSDILLQHAVRGRNRLVRVAPDGAITDVLGGDVDVVGHAAASGRTVAAVATADSFGELWVSDGGVVTEFGAAARASDLVIPTEVTAVGRDGYPVHGWIAKPPGDGPFPVILQIHGGPYAAYGIHLFDETQVLVDAGYAVVYCNPRGSSGYGSAHGRAIRHAMGTVDFDDVIDFFDAALAGDPALDGSRVGVQGGSYGGYLTAWIIAHDHRFAGAIVERGFLDPVSFQGTSDIGSFFGDEYVGTEPDDIARQSPMAHVDAVRTPTLVIHSELDYRCPLEQATRYYTALRRNGVATELLVFPGEDHELSRGGRPRHRVERFGAILEWWARRLPTDANPTRLTTLADMEER
jgi:dipeptidyl aminopeptidase/acylaminoacyl peptidase